MTSRYDIWRTAAPEDDEDATPLQVTADPNPALVALVDAARPFAAWWQSEDPHRPVPDARQWHALYLAVAAYDEHEPTQAHETGARS